MRLKLCCLADLHGHLPDMPESDIVIIAGDICPVYNHQLWFQKQWLQGTFYPWLYNLPAKYKVYIAGNHDFIFQSKDEQFKRSLFQYDHPMGQKGIYYLEDNGINIEGINIWGTPWQPVFCDWAFNLPEDELAKKFALIPEYTDILVSHGPPYGHGDHLPNRERVGSISLANRLKSIAASLVVCGHIHYARGIYVNKQCCQIINASMVNEDYKLVHKPIIKEIEYDRTSISLSSQVFRRVFGGEARIRAGGTSSAQTGIGVEKPSIPGSG
jgi:predicted phosphohydrolase